MLSKTTPCFSRSLDASSIDFGHLGLTALGIAAFILSSSALASGADKVYEYQLISRKPVANLQVTVSPEPRSSSTNTATVRGFAGTQVIADNEVILDDGITEAQALERCKKPLVNRQPKLRLSGPQGDQVTLTLPEEAAPVFPTEIRLENWDNERWTLDCVTGKFIDPDKR